MCEKLSAEHTRALASDGYLQARGWESFMFDATNCDLCVSVGHDDPRTLTEVGSVETKDTRKRKRVREDHRLKFSQSAHIQRREEKRRERERERERETRNNRPEAVTEPSAKRP